MIRNQIIALLLLSTLLGNSLVAICRANPIKVNLNWKQFLSHHDLAYEQTPIKRLNGAFLGNGLLGAVIVRDGSEKYGE